MATLAATTSECVDISLTCAPQLEVVYVGCGFARTTPRDPTNPEQCVPARDPAEMAAAKALLLAHLDRAGGSAPCCADRALHCRVCELHSLIVAEAVTLLRAVAADGELFPVQLNPDNRPKLWVSSGELYNSWNPLFRPVPHTCTRLLVRRRTGAPGSRAPRTLELNRARERVGTSRLRADAFAH